MGAEPAVVARDVRVAVGRLSRQLRRHYGQGQGGAGPSFLELAILVRLQRVGASSTSALATTERVTAQAVSAALAGLRRRGLVDLGTDPADRRRSRVVVNDAGARLLADREQRLSDRLTRTLSDHFTDQERARLARAAPLLERLADLL